ncbi:MAG: AAA family ATPase, partial [Syntrophales bacterium]|nr:AAA family ATPase [Syntrophales bacterium]
MKRYLYEPIKSDLSRKMVFLTGPRQIGKTFLAKQLLSEFRSPQYLNYDAVSDRRIILDQSWPLNADYLVFDEIHKMKDWKSYLKGVSDTRPANQSILVTGSARMETFRQSGESLAGRYFHHHFYPLSVR